jgi:hypothetical protein
MTDANNKIQYGLGLLQIQGCLQRIAIEKKRSFRITCCEYCSHLFLLLILVAGFNLSIILNYSSTIYSEFQLHIPNSASAVSFESSKPSDSSTISTSHSFFDGPLIVPTFDEYIYASRFLSRNVGSSGNLITQTSLGRSFTNL